ncbi:MAG: ABC transporter transmembrane domain-containing protein [Solidesulfovibrio sp.]|uniref:ABC transporter transmembrane domain-containing protein n=1 Tax=Solidesulfovibrio sp. TaxID=2910990 RepID=UPI0031597F56
MPTALTCLEAVAEAHGLACDRRSLADRFGLGGAEPDTATLLAMAASVGLAATAAVMDVRGMARDGRFPLIARLANGNSVVVVGVREDAHAFRVRVADPLAATPGSFEVDEEGFSRSHAGEVILVVPRLARSGLRALAMVGRHHGLPLSHDGLAHAHGFDAAEPTPDELVAVAVKEGLKAEARRLAPDELTELGGAYPVLAVLVDDRVVILAGCRRDAAGSTVDVVDPTRLPPVRETVPLATFAAGWDGRAILLRRSYRLTDENQPFGLRWFVPEILRHRKEFTDAAVAAVMLYVLALAMPIYFQIVIDKVLTHKGLSTLQVLSCGMLVALAFEAGFTYLRGILVLHAASRIDIRVAGRTFARLTSLPLRFFGQSRVGVLIQHMQQADKIREFLSGKLFFTLLDALALVVFIPVLFFYSVPLTLLVLGLSLVLGVFLAVIVPVLRARLLTLYKAEGDRQSFLVETIRGMETVKALSLEPSRRRGFEDAAARAVSTRFTVGRIGNAATASVGFLEKVMILCIPWIGVFLVFDGSLSVGALIAFQMLAGRVTQPLVQMVSLVQEYQEKGLAVKMLAAIMNEPPERAGSGEGVRPKLAGEVVFEAVTFRYGPDAASPAALCGLTVRFAAGQMIGVAGRSGSGKSTLARLIQGLYAPTEGSIRFDGHDLRECDVAHLRRQIGVVLQDSFLFSGTVRENIAMARPGATMDEVVWAARLSGAEEFIRRLPRGYDTVLEENGSNLSGGQRQRLAIARALLTNPRILILDEATSALDAESEAIVQDNMARIGRERTTIVISHRLSMLAGADAILVLDAGRLADYGTHGELLARCAVYRDLWNSQNRHVMRMPATTNKLT